MIKSQLILFRNKILAGGIAWFLILFINRRNHYLYQVALSLPSYLILVVYSKAAFTIGSEIDNMKDFSQEKEELIQRIK